MVAWDSFLHFSSLVYFQRSSALYFQNLITSVSFCRSMSTQCYIKSNITLYPHSLLLKVAGLVQCILHHVTLPWHFFCCFFQRFILLYMLTPFYLLRSSVCVGGRGVVEAMLCTATVVQRYAVHHWPALCTTNLRCAPGGPIVHHVAVYQWGGPSKQSDIAY